MIDINSPVDQGSDMVINKEDGSQELGTAEDRQVAVDEGQVIGEHTNGVPVVSDEKPERGPSGKFTSKK